MGDMVEGCQRSLFPRSRRVRTHHHHILSAGKCFGIGDSHEETKCGVEGCTYNLCLYCADGNTLQFTVLSSGASLVNILGIWETTSASGIDPRASCITPPKVPLNGCSSADFSATSCTLVLFYLLNLRSKNPQTSSPPNKPPPLRFHPQSFKKNQQSSPPCRAVQHIQPKICQEWSELWPGGFQLGV